MQTAARAASDPDASRRRLWLAIAPVRKRARAFDRTTALRQFFHQLRFDALSVLKSLPFLILLGFGLINLIGSATVEPAVRTEAHPVTAR